MPILTTEQITVAIGEHSDAWSDDGHAFVNAIAIAKAESGGNTTVYNGSCCYGLFQIHLRAHWNKIPGNSAAEKIRSLRDYKTNIDLAWQIYKEAGSSFSPWEVYTNGSYKKYLKEAEKAYGDFIIGELNDTPTPFSVAGDVFGAVTDPIAKLGDALGWITNPHNWLRLAAFVGGLVILVLALVSLLKSTSTGKQAIGVATTVATKGRA